MLETLKAIYWGFNLFFQGKDLSSARTRRMIFMAFGQWIAASLVATVLLPIHLLANVLVYKKIRGALTIRKALISGGGSLPPHVDKFFEVCNRMISLYTLILGLP